MCRSTSSPSAAPRRRAPRSVYQPMLFGAAEIRFADAKKRLRHERARGDDDGLSRRRPWPSTGSRAEEASLAAERSRVVTGGGRSPSPSCPPPRASRRATTPGKKELRRLPLPHADDRDLRPVHGFRAFSKPGEAEGDFRARLQHAGREKRDQCRGAAPQEVRAEDRRAPGEGSAAPSKSVERESEQATQQGFQAAISIGTTLIGAMLGRKAASDRHPRPRHDRRARGRPRPQGAAGHRPREGERRRLSSSSSQNLEEAFKAEADTLDATGDGLAEPIETLSAPADQAERHGQARRARVGSGLARRRRHRAPRPGSRCLRGRSSDLACPRRSSRVGGIRSRPLVHWGPAVHP